MKLHVTELPQTTLTLEPPFPEIFTGETVTLRYVHPKAVLTLQSAWAQIFTGDTVTLRCEVEGGSAGWRFKQYRDGHEEAWCSDQYSRRDGDSCTISYAQNSHSRVYWCESGQERSNAVTLSVSKLFSWVTLTASPGATVKEGEALNLTCEAAVNKTPRPELHYTIVRDGEPVTNSTDSALYSIASTEKSHTGSYTCAVESQGVKKSSQELHIEVQTSWHSAVAIGYRVSFTLIHFIVFTLLLLQYCRIQGETPSQCTHFTWPVTAHMQASSCDFYSVNSTPQS
ncbi:low affinity immunoglobulin gamma Fc region receptor II-like [Acipenser ruthenus]|uniref:low affinity immunoglobulin gamma Fc region receptor II-like n=1 Tax=Acipenser ruthenus TaxID=7906 RepID=UPI0027427669|nr:low affinity immunoglobulin gamma Fc region receptor II-like [Acipenser ruthenus]